MKKGLITAVIGVYILGLCTVFAWAALPENVEDALPPDARDLLEQLDDDTADSGTLSAGAAKLWNKAWTLLTAEVRSSVRVMVVLLGAVLLYGVAEGSFQAAGHPLMANFTPLAFVLVWFYNGQRGACSPLQKKAFYWFYPVHLSVLAVVTNGVL